MNKKGIVFFLLLIVATLSLGIFLWLHFIKSKNAQISIETLPISEVLVSGDKIGNSPIEKELKAGEITLKLIPLSQDKPLAPFEVKLNLAQGVKTIVRREFGEEDISSSGEIVSFTKDNSQNGSISIISIPDSVEIYLDGNLQGTTPNKISATEPGQHEIVLKGQNIKERKITIQTLTNYSTLITAYLSQSTNPTPSPSPTPTPNKKIKIKETGVGFLRVRSGPSTDDKEVAQAKPGEIFELLEPEDTNGWYKIKYSNDIEGWVSKDYVEIEEN